MSGSMVQRGECAIFDKWQRAKSAIDAGADLVIELPAYYVLQSADVFAKGAVQILDGMKLVDGISFGAECGDIEDIIQIADVMSQSGGEYDTLVKSDIKKGIGYPKASQNALLECLPHLAEHISKPNNTLAVSYVKAIKAINSPLVPFCIKRNNDYHGVSSYDGCLGASEIRNRIMSGRDYLDYADDYSKENIYNLKNAESFILGYLRNIDISEMELVRGFESGLANLVKNSASNACTLDEIFEMCVNKRYTLHRIKRYIMSVILGINYEAEADYIRILGIGKNGKNLLKKLKSATELDIITKVADYKKDNKMFATDIKATDFAALCSENVSLRGCGKDYINGPYVI